MTPLRLRRDDGFELSDDRARLDLDVVHGFLKSAYWSPGIARETIERAVAASWCAGLYAPSGAQVGFARLVTDHATFAYLADVFVVPAYRGRGLSKWMMAAVFDAAEIKGLRRILLATSTAHGLYAKFGFTPLARPEIFMEINRPNIYQPALEGAM